MDALGPLPPEWWAKWDWEYKSHPNHFPEKNGEPRQGRIVISFDDRFECSIHDHRRDKGLETLDEKERDAFVEMIRLMLKFRPDDRPSAPRVLNSAWMKNWALPASNKTWSKE